MSVDDRTTDDAELDVEFDGYDVAVDNGDAAGAAEEPGTAQRVWWRVTRRPREWWERPWTGTRITQVVVTAVTLIVTTMIMGNVVHLSFLPSRDLVFDATTPTGGDFGAHVWGPAYLRDHLLPSWRLNGWTMDWYAGMPAYRFYMVLPALMIVAADVFLKYGVAMKLVSVLGVVTIPASCWAFGRLAKFRYPIPELMAFGGLAFVLDESFSIWGGNVKSTMAGEFSFSISLSLGILALGVYAAGLRTGKYRVWSAVLIAAACVSHGIVLIYVAGAALVFTLVWIDRQRLKYALTVGVTAVLLTMWWTGPFLLNHAFMTDMKYGPYPDPGTEYKTFWRLFFPHDTVLDFIIAGLAVFGFLMCIARRHLTGAALGVTCLVFVGGVYLARDSLPVIGLLWNPRLLPFVYLLRYLLMAIGAFELCALAWNAFTNRRAQAWPSVGPATGMFGVAALSILIVLGWMYQVLPGGGLVVADEGQPAVYQWGPFQAPQRDTQTADAQADGWARYNFRGYEGRGSYYTEYYEVVQTMAGLGSENGCGRALWENNSDNGNYGTTMALMLLPFWTDGCIGSMEGLFFEASGTTPYHFLTASAMSQSSSNPVRKLRYVDRNAEVGVRHLQELGVRYVMVRTDGARSRAAAQSELTLVGESYPWEIYEVADSDLVVPLSVQPVVVNPRSGDQRERNLELGTSWFQNPDEWAAMPADGGPADWQRIDVVVDEARREINAEGEQTRVDVVRPYGEVAVHELPAATVSNVDIGDQSLSFDVDQATVDAGVPVLVRVSYFPNWRADGAEGPWRIGPNMMVVVPTSTHVEMHFARSASDYITILLTIVGVGLCVVWRRRGDMEFDSEQPGLLFGRAAGPAGDDGDGDGDDTADLFAPRSSDQAEQPVLTDDLWNDDWVEDRADERVEDDLVDDEPVSDPWAGPSGAQPRWPEAPPGESDPPPDDAPEPSR